MHRLESHKWVEVNSRVNYPVIVEKLESGEFFYENPKVQYCVSWLYKFAMLESQYLFLHGILMEFTCTCKADHDITCVSIYGGSVESHGVFLTYCTKLMIEQEKYHQEHFLYQIRPARHTD